MQAWGWLFVVFSLWAQEPPPTANMKGTLLEWDGSASTGELSVRAADHYVHCFLFDSRTQFQRDELKVSVTALRPGDRLEVVSDSGNGPGVRYARSVRAEPGRRPVPVPSSRWLYGLSGSLVDEFFPRGNLFFNGTVSRINGDRMILRVRAKGEKRILFREDTRYLYDGSMVKNAVLKVNTRVFVRAGENLDGDLEAFQVVWGGILQPEK